MRSFNAAEQFADLFFPDLPTPVIRQLRAGCSKTVVPRGESVELGNDELGTIVFVVNGAAKLVGHVGADREQIVVFAFAGEQVMLSAPSQDAYALWAITDCELIAIPAGRLIRSAAGDGELVKALFVRALSALERSRATTVMLGRKSAKERLATFLSTMGDRIGRSVGGGVVLALPMSRREIADSLGLTIETVSRQFTELRALGVIETRGRSDVTILSPERLRRLAGFLR